MCRYKNLLREAHWMVHLEGMDRSRITVVHVSHVFCSSPNWPGSIQKVPV